MRATASPVRVWLAVVAAVCLAGGSADAQSTRAEEIDQARRDKQARLWPERESPLVRQANDILERGFQEGIEDGKGASGPQLVLGGVLSAEGQSRRLASWCQSFSRSTPCLSPGSHAATAW